MVEQREKITREVTVSPWGPGSRKVTFRVEGSTGSGILALYMVDEPPADISMCYIEGSVQVSKSVELAKGDDARCHRLSHHRPYPGSDIDYVYVSSGCRYFFRQ